MKEFEVKVLLLVEDSDDDILITQRKLFKSYLKIGDFLVAKNLEEAMKIISSVNTDVVLLDLNLPETRGLDTLKIIRENYPGIIIVCTSIEDEHVGIQAIREGADDYLIKSQITETTLCHSVLYARERHKVQEYLKAANDKIAQLIKITDKVIK